MNRTRNNRYDIISKCGILNSIYNIKNIKENVNNEKNGRSKNPSLNKIGTFLHIYVLI